MIEIKKKLKENRNKNKSTSPVVYSSFIKMKEGVPKVVEEIIPKTRHNSRIRNKLNPLTKIKWGKSLYSMEQEKEEKEKKEKKIEYKNYLNEFKKKNMNEYDESEDENEAFNPYWDWKTINQDSGMDEASKVILLKEKAHMLEERSKLKEELLYSGSLNPEKSNIANNFLIASIEAKLAILDKLNYNEQSF